MNITFKKISLFEIDVAMSLFSSLYLELGEESESDQFLNSALIKDLLTSGKTEVFFVKDAQFLCGAFSLTEYGSLDEFYILPEHRNKGLGQICIEFIKNLALNKGWKRIDVTAPSQDSMGASRFYKRSGFVFTGSKYKIKIN